VKETLHTLALLFPPGDKDTKRWYKKHEAPEDLDDSVLHCGLACRNIEEYTYWHDRLIMLKEKFDEPNRTTIKQLWNDRREGIQWYTLWVAIVLTLFFGLVQSIEGGIQVYKALSN
jgi:hypothetical protein